MEQPRELVLTTANAAFVTRQLLVGGDLDTRDTELAASQLGELVEAGVTHVVDARIEWNDEEWVSERAPEIGYLHHGMDDAGQRVPGEWFDVGVSWALEAMKGDGVVLTHCHMGINRGPSIAYAIMLAQGWPPVAALDTIRGSRPIAAIGYATDALDWWHRLSRATDSEVARDLGLVGEWFAEHPLDVVRTIRDVRAAENSAARSDGAGNSTAWRAPASCDQRMRATVDIDEQLLDAVRLLAIETDRRLDDVLDDALRLLLASVATSRPITFPTYGARTLLGD